MYKAKVNIYLDRNREKVIVADAEGNAPGAKFLLASKGKEVSNGLVKNYGLKKYVTGAAESDEVEETESDEAPDTKAVESKDVQNKAITSKATKRK